MSSASETGAFGLLSSGVQQAIWRMGWSELRAIQTQAITALCTQGSDLLIASGTASGKTEAAFLPVLSELDRLRPESVGCLYVAPLKALINDQQDRLIRLADELDLPVIAWHGDVSDSIKKKVRREGRGILQITPESLEGLLTRRPREAAKMFSQLRFIVVDELHAFMGDERGLQLQCLLDRLGSAPVRIGLSATLGDLSQATRWLRPGAPERVQVIQDNGSGRRIRLSVSHHDLPPHGEIIRGPLTPAAPQEPAPAPPGRSEEHLTPDELRELGFKAPEEITPAVPTSQRSAEHDAESDLQLHLAQLAAVHKGLVFVDSRQGVEDAASAIIREHRRMGHSSQVYVHHGSVSGSLRAETEAMMRDPERPGVTVCTVTLEMGIDLGALDRVVQRGAPASVSSFVQRLGRAGRRGQAAEMAFVTSDREVRGGSVAHNLPWELLITCASIQLYLEERWVEPAAEKELPWSLAVHQTLCLLEAAGGLKGPELAARLLHLAPFVRLPRQGYLTLLRHLLQEQWLRRDEDGTLLPGERGEKLVHDWRFLAVFDSEQEVSVIHGQQAVGSLSDLPAMGEVFTLAGRHWETTGTDERGRRVWVKPTRKRRSVRWRAQGDDHTHTRVQQRVHQLLGEETMPSYLTPQAAEHLTRARQAARESGLLHSHMHSLGGSTLLTPWGGAALQRSLQTLLRHWGEMTGHQLTSEPIWRSGMLTVPCGPETLRALLATLPAQEEVERRVRQELMDAPVIPREKYDPMVPRELLVDAELHDHLNLGAARRWLEGA